MLQPPLELTDRPGHDRRYALDATKITTELDWHLSHTDFAQGLEDTIRWYSDHRSWWEPVKAQTEEHYRRRLLALSSEKKEGVEFTGKGVIS